MGRPVDQIDRKTLEMLVCPLTKTRLILTPEGDELISVVAHLAFPIRKGVPMLSLEEARQVDLEEMDRLRQQAAHSSEPDLC